MILVIAEKPSVAQTIAAVLGAKEKKDGFLTGSGYIVSWCVGHLVGLSEAAAYGEQYKKWSYDSLPILPQEWKYTVASDKEKQFKTLKELMHRADVSKVVNACDAGREGELIFRFVYEMAGCKKPMRRLWISSMEDSAIKEGFSRLKNGEEYDALFASALCRAKADWLIGINATRLFSVLYNHTLNVGRVQTPTLKMLVDRDAAITTFKKEKYYHVRLALSGAEAASERISDKAEADALKTTCEASRVVCTSLVKEKKTIAPPKPFDLTSLQREANRLFGYTAKQTLDLAQALYEKRLLTYPRTDSQYVTEDMKETVKMLAEGMTDFLPFLESGQIRGNIDRVVNNAKVSDHHAILPTKEAMEKGMGGLSGGKKNLLMLIGQQLVQATGEEYLYEQTEISVQCKEHEFTAKGKLPVQMGFKEVEEAFRKYCVKDKKSDEPDNKTELPEGYEEGMTLASVKAEKSTHYTSPPKMFTEDTLLAAMETAGNKEFDSETEKKGLGTPATRANIIEKLVSSGYAERKGKQIFPTVAGCELIHVMPENLKSASLTAEWENQLLMMEKGKIHDDEFMDGIVSMITDVLSVCRAIPEEERNRFQTAREVIGKCPVCGSDVYEGKTNYYCSDRSCPFALWKSNRFLESMKKSMDKKMAVELLKKGRTHVKGLYSKKKDSKFDADLVLGVEDGKARFSLEFPKKKK